MSISSSLTMPNATTRGKIERNDSANHSKYRLSEPPSMGYSARQSGLLKAGVEQQPPKPGANVRTASTCKELIEHRHHPVTQRRRWPCPVHYRKIIFMKHGEPTWLEHARAPLQDCQRVLRMNQNMPSDHGIKSPRRIPIMH